MAALDFSRSVYKPLRTKEKRLFDAILDFTRDDSVAVDFTGDSILMEITARRGQAAAVTLASGTEITISTASLIFDVILSTLNFQIYQYTLYNDTRKEGIAHGPIEVI